jgi:hypothetical protein
LLLQAIGSSSPCWQVPRHLASIFDWSGRGSGNAAKLGCSGSYPVSMMPTMTPSPARFGSPKWLCHTPFGPSSPRNAGVLIVWVRSSPFLNTLTTPGVPRRRRSSAAVNFAANPLNAVS